MIERNRKNQDFRRAIETPPDAKDLRQLNLLAYLITPVQRLPRYELMLKDLLRHTWLEHPDKQNLQLALDSIRAEIVDLNESKKQDSTRKKLAELQNKYREPSELDSLFGGGHFLCEASAKSYDESGKLSKVFMVLFEDQLLISKRSKDLYKKTQRYSDAKAIMLGTLEQPVEPLDDLPDKGFGLKVASKERVYRLALKDPIERNKWVRDINSACNKLQAKVSV